MILPTYTPLVRPTPITAQSASPALGLSDHFSLPAPASATPALTQLPRARPLSSLFHTPRRATISASDTFTTPPPSPVRLAGPSTSTSTAASRAPFTAQPEWQAQAWMNSVAPPIDDSLIWDDLFLSPAKNVSANLFADVLSASASASATAAGRESGSAKMEPMENAFAPVGALPPSPISMVKPKEATRHALQRIGSSASQWEWEEEEGIEEEVEVRMREPATPSKNAVARAGTPAIGDGTHISASSIELI